MLENNDTNAELIKRILDGDEEAKELLVQNNLGLIWKIVRKFSNRGHEPEDLFQIGAIGFIKSINKFDFSFDVRFSTYAVPMIIGEIKRFLRDDGIIKISRSIKETSSKARITKEILSKEFGREPTVNEIANRLKISAEELAVALDSQFFPESLDATVYEGESNPVYRIDLVKANECEDKKIVDKILLNKILSELKPNEKKIIILRYFKERTQSQIAKMLGISQVQVSRIEKRILQDLKSKYGTQ